MCNAKLDVRTEVEAAAVETGVQLHLDMGPLLTAVNFCAKSESILPISCFMPLQEYWCIVRAPCIRRTRGQNWGHHQLDVLKTS